MRFYVTEGTTQAVDDENSLIIKSFQAITEHQMLKLFERGPIRGLATNNGIFGGIWPGYLVSLIIRNIYSRGIINFCNWS